MQESPQPSVVAFGPEDLGAFLAATAGRAIAPLSADAIARASAGKGGMAIDLGCGAGNEVLGMLAANMPTTAVDAYEESLAMTRAAAERVGLAHLLSTTRSLLEDVPLKAGAFALVHARFSIPFVPAVRFETLWSGIQRAIQPGGILCCQLFGPNDGFIAERPSGSMNYHDAGAVRGLLSELDILHLEEVDRDGVTATGRAKHWHVHHIIAQRSAL